MANKGMTLVEILVAVVITAVAITSMVAALSGLQQAEYRVLEKDIVSRLAHEKLEEMVATQGFISEAGGSFSDPRYQNYTWTVEEIPTGIEYLSGVRVTVNSDNGVSSQAETLFYDYPEEAEEQ